jgi:hypothetical protein
MYLLFVSALLTDYEPITLHFVDVIFEERLDKLEQKPEVPQSGDVPGRAPACVLSVPAVHAVPMPAVPPAVSRSPVFALGNEQQTTQAPRPLVHTLTILAVLQGTRSVRIS